MSSKEERNKLKKRLKEIENDEQFNNTFKVMDELNLNKTYFSLLYVAINNIINLIYTECIEGFTTQINLAIDKDLNSKFKTLVSEQKLLLQSSVEKIGNEDKNLSKLDLKFQNLNNHFEKKIEKLIQFLDLKNQEQIEKEKKKISTLLFQLNLKFEKKNIEFEKKIINIIESNNDLESVLDLDKQIIQIKKEKDLLQKKLEQIEVSKAEMKTTIKKLEDDYNVLVNQSIKRLEEKIELKDKELTSIKMKLDKSEKDVDNLIEVHKTGFSQIIKEIDSYKKIYQTERGKVSTLEDKVSTLEDKVSTLEDKVSTLEDKIKLMTDESEKNKSLIEQLNKQVVTYTSENNKYLEDRISHMVDFYLNSGIIEQKLYQMYNPQLPYNSENHYDQQYPTLNAA